MVDHYDIPEFYEPEIVNVAGRFIKPGDLAIDIGASVGFFTRLFSNLVGDQGRVLAFEPNLESFEHLKRNIEKHQINNARYFRLALWSQDLVEIRLWSTKELGYTSICEYVVSVSSETVEARSLDSMYADIFEQADFRPSFIKIDCEASEFEVLKGAERILRRGVDCVIVEFNYSILNQLKISDHIFRDYMRSLGYDMFLINITDENGDYLDPIKVENHRNIYMNGVIRHMNVMFTTEEKVRERWNVVA